MNHNHNLPHTCLLFTVQVLVLLSVYKVQKLHVHTRYMYTSAVHPLHIHEASHTYKHVHVHS
jgi:hypothetical protein